MFVGLADAKGVHVVEAVQRRCLMLEASRLAGGDDLSVDLEPEFLVVRRDLTHRFAGAILNAGLPLEGRVYLEEAVIHRFSLFIEQYFHRTEAFINRVEQRAVLLLRPGKCLFNTGAFQPRPEATGDFAHQFDFLGMPVAGLGVIKAEREPQLFVSGDGDDDVRSDMKRGEGRRIDARIGVSVAHHKGLSGAHEVQKLVGVKVRGAVAPDEARLSCLMPIGIAHRTVQCFVEFEESAARGVKMPAQLRAERVHRRRDVRQPREVCAHFSQESEVRLKPPAPGHVLHHGQQPLPRIVVHSGHEHLQHHALRLGLALETDRLPSVEHAVVIVVPGLRLVGEVVPDRLATEVGNPEHGLHCRVHSDVAVIVSPV